MTHVWVGDENGGQTRFTGTMARDPDGTPVLVIQRETTPSDVSRETSTEGETHGA